MKTRKTTYEERIEIVEWTIKNNMNYKKASGKYEIPYANIYKWTKNYLENGKEALKYKKRGRKTKTKIKKQNLTETERLKLELDEERALRKRRELEIEI
ncbi:helix-turn-helix domain-containing protein [Neofamilia massiliensis]|nr:helix-turn-helix domain-containing protein [Neofamilia massiliensis]